MWPEAERIRCWVHKMRNILDKVPEEVRPELKAHLVAIRDAADYKQGERLAEEVMEKYGKTYPSAMQCLRDDLAASLAHLKLPVLHRRSIRTTNLVLRGGTAPRQSVASLPHGERMPQARLCCTVAGQRPLAGGSFQRARAETVGELPLDPQATTAGGPAPR